MWSITNMSMIDNGTFWHCQLEEITFKTVQAGHPLHFIPRPNTRTIRWLSKPLAAELLERLPLHVTGFGTPFLPQLLKGIVRGGVDSGCGLVEREWEGKRRVRIHQIGPINNAVLIPKKCMLLSGHHIFPGVRPAHAQYSTEQLNLLVFLPTEYVPELWILIRIHKDPHSGGKKC